MNLNYLQEFITLVETENFSRAAEQLSISQSTISKHIAALEAELGVQLFERRQKMVTLNEFGTILYPFARKMLSEQKKYSELINMSRGYENKSINIGTIGSMRLYGLMEPINQFRIAYPGIEVNIYQKEYGLKKDLLNKQIDMAFVRESEKMFFNDEQIKTMECISDSVVVILPTGHPAAQNGSIHLSQLRDELFYFLDWQLPFTRLCINACNAAGFSPKIAGTGFSGADIIALIGRGGGASFLSKKLFLRDFSSDGRVTSADLAQSIQTHISLIYLNESENAAANHSFLTFWRSNKMVSKISKN